MAFRPFNRKSDEATLFRARKSPTNDTLTFQQWEGPNYSVLSPNHQSNGILSFRHDKGPSYFEPDNRQSMIPYPSNQTKGSDYSISSPANQHSTTPTPYNRTKAGQQPAAAPAGQQPAAAPAGQQPAAARRDISSISGERPGSAALSLAFFLRRRTKKQQKGLVDANVRIRN
uniref:Uncharacterized protein n=1 Tax=Solanum tuberosum TaxID=4113 RepID=M1D9V4_SOLTU